MGFEGVDVGDWRCAKKVEDRSRRTELSVEYGFVDDRVVLRTCPSKGLGGSPRREDVFGGGIVLFFKSREGRVWGKTAADLGVCLNEEGDSAVCVVIPRQGKSSKLLYRDNLGG